MLYLCRTRTYVQVERYGGYYMSDELVLVQNLIHEIRGKKVMLDFDLAKLYHVTTGNLNQALKRNINRFPSDFMFQLDLKEFTNLKSQNVISSWGGTRKLPHAFTEQGVAMLSSVLHSETAIQVNISIMRAFVKIREYLLTSSSLSSELKELKARVDLLQIQQEETNGAISDLSEDVRRDIDSLYIAIGQLAEKIEEKKNEPRRKIGFKQAAGEDCESNNN